MLKDWIKQLEQISEYLVKNNLSVAVAESVTAGEIQLSLSGATNATCFFQGGITCYNLGQKVLQLSVDPIKAEAVNCVSQDVSDQMAASVCKKFLADFGIAITGYAEPVPEKNINSRFAFLSICRNNKIVLRKKLSSNAENDENAKHDFTTQTLNAFSNILV